MEAGIKTWMRSKLIQNAQVFSILPRSRWVMLRRLVSRCHKKFQMTHFVFCSTLPRPQIKNSNWKRTQKHMSNFMIKLFFFSLYFWIWYWTYLSSTFNPNGSLSRTSTPAHRWLQSNILTEIFAPPFLALSHSTQNISDADLCEIL